MRKRRTIAEKDLHSLLPGYHDHFAMVHQIAKEMNLSPDSIDVAIRGYFGFHGIQHYVINNRQQINVPGLGKFRPSRHYSKEAQKAIAARKKRKLGMRRAINRRASKKHYDKLKLLKQ